MAEVKNMTAQDFFANSSSRSRSLSRVILWTFPTCSPFVSMLAPLVPAEREGVVGPFAVLVGRMPGLGIAAGATGACVIPRIAWSS